MGNVTFVPHAWAEKEVGTVKEKRKNTKMEIRKCADSRPRLSAGQSPASPRCHALFRFSACAESQVDRKRFVIDTPLVRSPLPSISSEDERTELWIFSWHE
jgi:hypothetical protein